MRSVYNDVELLTIREIMGILRMGRRRAYALVKTLPKNAVIRSGRGRPGSERFLVHAWALGKHLKMEKCPGCNRTWPEED